MTPTLAPSQLTTRPEIMKFMFSGDVRFTLVSRATKERFTYRVQAKREQGSHNHRIYYVSWLSVEGGTNGDLRYMGVLFSDGGFHHATLRSKLDPDHKAVVAFEWFTSNYWKESCLRQMEFWVL